MEQGGPELETAIVTSAQFDHRKVDWPRVRRGRYLIHQHLRYEYPGSIRNLRQRLIILPPEQYGDQRLVTHRFEVSLSTARPEYQSDSFGNRQLSIFVPRVEQCIDFEAWILIEREAQNRQHYLSSTWLTNPRLLEPSALTQPNDELRQIARELMDVGEGGLALAERINTWVYHHIQYAHEVTDIHTTAAQALLLQRGVCQDYAHLMLALCRLCALPARYVSGHMLGEGGTHAWVEVIVPVADQPDIALAVPFDPTHDRQATLSYLTIAVGRDYFDVAPTSGTYEATYSGQLSGRKHVGLTHLDYEETVDTVLEEE